MKQIIQMFGLPGSGKSTWIEKQRKQGKLNRFTIVSADKIKKASNN